MDVPLQFVVGKGGVGKSTLTAALALRAASQGLRTLVVEFGGHGGVSRLFDRESTRPGELSMIAPRLTLLSLEGDEALGEYLRIVIPIRRLLALVFKSRLYHVFVAGAPGLKELMTVGKVWYEADRRMADGESVWQRIFVDAGASGHSLQYLQMPSAATATFRTGLVHREATKVQAMLSDPSRTCVHVVATPEEMPVTEACSIVSRLRHSLRLPLGTLFVNRCREAVPAGAPEALSVLEHVSVQEADASQRALLHAVAAAVDAAIEWEAIQQTAIARVEAETGMRAARLPLLAAEEFGRAEVEKLAAMLEAAAGSAMRSFR